MLSMFKLYFRDLKKHTWLHLVTVITISLSVFLVSLILFFQSSVLQWIRSVRPSPIAFVYLKEGLDFTSVTKLKEKIQGLPKIKLVRWKSRDQIWQDVESTLGGKKIEVQTELTALLPDIIEVEFTSLSKAVTEQFQLALQGMTEISDIDLPENWTEKFQKFEWVIHWVGWGLVGLLFLGFIFIGSNVIFLRNRSREQQVEYLHLLGASKWYLLRPILLESMVEGVLGSTLGILFLMVSLETMRSFFTSKLSSFGIQLVPNSPAFAQLLLYFFAGIFAAVTAGTLVAKRILPEQQ